MTTGALNDFREWLAVEGLQWSTQAGPTLPGCAAAQLSVRVPDRFHRLLVMLDAVMEPCAQPCFDGVAMFIGDSVWGDTIADLIYSRVRSQAARQARDLAGAPFTAFAHSEYDDAYALTLIAAFARWDAWLVAARAGYIVDLSHDGFVDITCKAADVIGRVADRLKAGKFDFNMLGR